MQPCLMLWLAHTEQAETCQSCITFSINYCRGTQQHAIWQPTGDRSSACRHLIAILFQHQFLIHAAHPPATCQPVARNAWLRAHTHMLTLCQHAACATSLAGRSCPAHRWQPEQSAATFAYQQQAPASGTCPQHNRPPTQGSTTLSCSASQRPTHTSTPPTADADKRVMLVCWPQCSSAVSCLQPQHIDGRSSMLPGTAV